jgi:undecaprenyl-diphosphatase
VSPRPLRWSGAALAAFAAIAVLVQTGWVAAWDRGIFRRLYSGVSDWPMGRTTGRGDDVLQTLLPWFNRAADERKLVLLVVVVIVALGALRWWRAAVFFAGAAGVVVLTGLLKDLFGRPSPFPLPGDPSFPSGHATLTMAIAAAWVVIAAGTRAAWAVAAAGAALVLAVAVSAIADGGHWPTDIAGGWAVALAWVFAMRAVIAGPLRSTLPVSSSPATARAHIESS